MHISGYMGALAVSGEAHVRRSTFIGDSIGILGYLGELLAVENSSIGAGTSTEVVTSGLFVQDIQLELNHVSIVGSARGIECRSGLTGRVRNSLILSVEESFPVDCDGLTFSGNATEQAGFGATVGVYEPGWFENAAAGDLHLTTQGEAAIPLSAPWAQGDPIADVDGDLRSTESDNYPGFDQP
jgi:hypothetical protein